MKYVIVFVVLFALNSIDARGIPSYIKRCKQGDPNLGKCISERVRELKPKLLNGSPELNIPVMEPLFIPKLEVSSGTFTAIFKDLKAHGAKDFEIRELIVKHNPFIFIIVLHLPELRLEMDYEFHGKIIMLEFNSKGKASINMTQIDTYFEMTGTEVLKNNQHYIDYQTSYVNVTLKNPHLRFDDIFKGNAELTDQTNVLLNEHFDDVSQEIQPLIQDAIATYCGSIIHNFFLEFSIEELFE